MIEIIKAIRGDYAENTTHAGQWMPILWLREGTYSSRFSKAQLTAALEFLARGDSPERDILLEEQPNQKTLTEAARRAGVWVGGRLLTEIRIG